MRRLKGWGWAGTGALAVLMLTWLGVTIWTAIKQQSDETRITRIERIVQRHPRPKHHRVHPGQGGGAQNPSTAGQQPKPGHAPGGKGGGVGGGHGQHHPPPRTPPGSPAPAPEPAPAPATAVPAPEAQPSSSPVPGESGETPAVERSEGVHACVDLVVSACVEAGAPKLLP